MSGWRPIETAPPACQDYARGPFETNPVLQREMRSGVGVFEHDGLIAAVHWNMETRKAHWMPLPEPPK